MTNFYIFDLFFIYRPKPPAPTPKPPAPTPKPPAPTPTPTPSGDCPCNNCCYWPLTGQQLPGWTQEQCNANPANNFKWCGGSRLLRSSH